MLILTFSEQRWAVYYAQFSVVLMALALNIGLRLFDDSARKVALTLAAVALGGAAMILLLPQQDKRNRILAGEVLDKQIAQRILMKRFAVQMAHLVKAGEARLLAEPTLAPSLYYFGHLSSTVTFYWENVAGSHAAADFFDAMDDQDALRIARERGLTHVLIPENSQVPMVFHRVRTGQPPKSGDLNLAARLMKGEGAPAWMTRNPAMTHLADCIFASYRVAYPIAVWEIVPPGSVDDR